jgi:signal peptidase I
MDDFETVNDSNASARPESGLAIKTGRPLLRALREVLLTVVPALFIALFVNVFVAQASMILQHSMEPNLHENERVIVEKITYRFVHGPRRGDIVVVEIPGQEIPLVKRVVALPGEKVAVQGGRVFINDQLLDEPWVERYGGRDYPPEVVPPLHVFILGDNRGVSHDSRAIGPVHVDQIVGRVWFVYWPLDQIGWID